MECACLNYLAAVFSGLAILTVYYLRKRNEHFSKFEKFGIKGPRPSLLWGNIWEIYRKTHKQCQREWHERFGPVVGYYFGYQPTLLISDGDLLGGKR